jgi:hypothetical protein
MKNAVGLSLDFFCFQILKISKSDFFNCNELGFGEQNNRIRPILSIFTIAKRYSSIFEAVFIDI